MIFYFLPKAKELEIHFLIYSFLPKATLAGSHHSRTSLVEFWFSSSIIIQGNFIFIFDSMIIQAMSIFTWIRFWFLIKNYYSILFYFLGIHQISGIHPFPAPSPFRVFPPDNVHWGCDWVPWTRNSSTQCRSVHMLVG